jgi:hypothetical protein
MEKIKKSKNFIDENIVGVLRDDKIEDDVKVQRIIVLNHFRDLLDNKLFNNNTTGMSIIYDGDDYIYEDEDEDDVTDDEYEKLDKHGYIIIDVDFNVEVGNFYFLRLVLGTDKINDELYGDYYVRAYDGGNEDDNIGNNIFPLSRIIKHLNRSNDLLELGHYKEKYLNSDLYEKEKQPYMIDSTDVWDAICESEEYEDEDYNDVGDEEYDEDN